MTPHLKYGIAGVAVGLILLIFLPTWLALGIVAAAIAVPIIMYAMLDDNQKRRLRQARSRKQIGR